MKIFLITISLLLTSSYVHSQQLIKGKVTEKESGQAIEGANIVILGTTSGTTTNSNGEFEIESKKKKITVVISHLSYQALQTDVSSKVESNLIELDVNVMYIDPPINIGIGEYSGPMELIEFSEDEYQEKLETRIEGLVTETFTVVEMNTEFYGGMNNLSAYLAHNFKYSGKILTDKLEGIARVRFDVLKDGTPKLLDIKIDGEDSDDQVLNEFKRLMNSMPKWYPAFQRGKAVKTSLLLNVKYSAKNYDN